MLNTKTHMKSELVSSYVELCVFAVTEECSATNNLSYRSPRISLRCTTMENSDSHIKELVYNKEL
jgi:hypothetical protein